MDAGREPRQPEIVAQSADLGAALQSATPSMVGTRGNLAESDAFTYNAQTISSHVTGESPDLVPAQDGHPSGSVRFHGVDGDKLLVPLPIPSRTPGQPCDGTYD
jgi:hypothetical protein